jgi:NAD-dependent deacetylase
MKTILVGKEETALGEAARHFTAAARPVALTGAGISVNSGIADFRSPGGLWSHFSPDEYATLEVFRRNPAKAWQLYRALGRELLGKKPNAAHHALADLESRGLLHGLVTQNVDNLHQLAGSRRVLEIHGDHQHLQCLRCGDLIPVEADHYHAEEVPHCRHCRSPYKPNVVLFGEAVRDLEQIEELIGGCDLLLVIGTSAQVYPAAGLPGLVKQRGGLVYEFNLEQALTASAYGDGHGLTDYFFAGDLAATLPHFVRTVCG